MSSLVPGCLSCDIVAGRRREPGGVIYENEYWHVWSTVGPLVWRRFLIAKLKRRCKHLSELTAEESVSLGPAVQATCQALMETLRPGVHSVMFNLDLLLTLTGRLGIRRWMVDDRTVGDC